MGKGRCKNSLSSQHYWLCLFGKGIDSRSFNSLSVSEVDVNSSNCRGRLMGMVLMYHHTQLGPLGQSSGRASHSGSGLHTSCIIMTCKGRGAGQRNILMRGGYSISFFFFPPDEGEGDEHMTTTCHLCQLLYVK